MKVNCPYCLRPAQLVTGAVLYPQRPEAAARWFWRCARCDAHVGTHPTNHQHKPLGRLANRELRTLRMRAGSLFDALWENGGTLTRAGAYEWLRRELGLSAREAHIAGFDIEQCQRLIRAIEDGQHLHEDTPG